MDSIVSILGGCRAVTFLQRNIVPSCGYKQILCADFWTATIYRLAEFLLNIWCSVLIFSGNRDIFAKDSWVKYAGVSWKSINIPKRWTFNLTCKLWPGNIENVLRPLCDMMVARQQSGQNESCVERARGNNSSALFRWLVRKNIYCCSN